VAFVIEHACAASNMGTPQMASFVWGPKKERTEKARKMFSRRAGGSEDSSREDLGHQQSRVREEDGWEKEIS